MKTLQKVKEFFALTAPEEFEDDYEDAPQNGRRPAEAAGSGTGPYRPVSYGAAAARDEARGQRYQRDPYDGGGRVGGAGEVGAARPQRPAPVVAAAQPLHTRPVAADPRPAAVVRPEPRVPLALAEDANPLAKITTVRPRSYGEAQTIGEQFRDGVPVIMDLNDMSTTDAKRLVDFAAGLVFGLRGSFGKVATKVFLISPAGVNVTDDVYRRLAESGFHAAP